jgi:hypothetical protein
MELSNVCDETVMCTRKLDESEAFDDETVCLPCFQHRTIRGGFTNIVSTIESRKLCLSAGFNVQ